VRLEQLRFAYIPCDVVEDECRGAGVWVLEGAPHALAHSHQRCGGTTTSGSFVVGVVIAFLPFRRLSNPTPHITITSRVQTMTAGSFQFIRISGPLLIGDRCRHSRQDMNDDYDDDDDAAAAAAADDDDDVS